LNHIKPPEQYKLGKHRSNALELVNKVPVVEVDGNMAVCDGGGGALGHPLEYISLERPGAVESCKYCALKYTKKKKH
jgi:NADH dehydrogenase (ubiquinone) Fe-S protein 6